MNSGRKRTRNSSRMKGSSFRPEFIDNLKMLVIERAMVNKRGEIAEKDFARLWGVSERLIREWKSPKSKYYQPEFAKAWAECKEAAEANQIKRGLVERAKGYKSTHIVTETNIGPEGKETKKKREVVEHPPDVAAAKVCLNNMGPKATRWNVKEQTQQEMTIVPPDKKHRPALQKLADEYTKTVLNAGS